MKVEKCPRCGKAELFNSTWSIYQYQCDCHEESGDVMLLLTIRWNRWARREAKRMRNMTLIAQRKIDTTPPKIPNDVSILAFAKYEAKRIAKEGKGK